MNILKRVRIFYYRVDFNLTKGVCPDVACTCFTLLSPWLYKVYSEKEIKELSEQSVERINKMLDEPFDI